jgi:hypothetical protein
MSGQFCVFLYEHLVDLGRSDSSFHHPTDQKVIDASKRRHGSEKGIRLVDAHRIDEVGIEGSGSHQTERIHSKLSPQRLEVLFGRIDGTKSIDQESKEEMCGDDLQQIGRKETQPCQILIEKLERK